MTSHLLVRAWAAAALGACVLAACSSTPPEPDPAPPASPPPPSQTGPDQTLVSWAGAYCGAVKDLRLIVYTMPKGYDIKSEADLPKAETALRSLDTMLTAAVTGLEKLPKIAPPAQEANTLAADDLAFYRQLQGKVTEYRTILPRGGVKYAQSALTLSGLDLATRAPAVESGKVPGLSEAMKANESCKLVG